MDRGIIGFLPVFIAGGAINPDEGAQQAANFRGLMFNAYFVTAGGFLTLKQFWKIYHLFLAERPSAGEGPGQEDPEQD